MSQDVFDHKRGVTRGWQGVARNCWGGVSSTLFGKGMCITQSRKESLPISEVSLQTLCLSSPGFLWRLLLTTHSLTHHYTRQSLTRPSDIAARSRWLECLHPTLRHPSTVMYTLSLLCVDTDLVTCVWEHSSSQSDFGLPWVTWGPDKRRPCEGEEWHICHLSLRD